MNKLSEVISQVTKDASIEPGMKQMAAVLLNKFGDAIHYGSSRMPSQCTLGYNHLLEYMRNFQEMHVQLSEATDKQGHIDMNIFRGAIRTITNSNPISGIMSIRFADTTTTVTSAKIPARSCDVDLTCGNRELIPLAIASGHKNCTDADYLMNYLPSPGSLFNFYYKPLGGYPMHCLFTHPLQAPGDSYWATSAEYKEQLRQEHVTPFWERVVRLSPKIMNFCIEI